jgi:hypothetical protein
MAAKIAAGIALLEGAICVVSVKYLGVRPVFTTWLLFFIASSLSFWTYWSSKKHSVRGNIANFMDMFVCGVITLSILSYAGGDLVGRSIDIYCLIASALILVFWRIKRQHGTANILLQLVMVVAYLPTIGNLWEATRNTESLPVWILAWFGAVFAFISASVERDKLGKIYAGRGLVLVSIVIWLIARIYWVVHP